MFCNIKKYRNSIYFEKLIVLKYLQQHISFIFITKLIHYWNCLIGIFLCIFSHILYVEMRLLLSLLINQHVKDGLASNPILLRANICIVLQYMNIYEPQT